MNESPLVVIIGGANGAGKSTAAELLLPADMFFLNADVVARELPESLGASKDVEAGRIVLNKMEELRLRGESFAYESTLSGRSLFNRLKELKETGYRMRLIYIWSPSADLNVARVSDRVLRGGHDVPEWVIRRRFSASWRNFLELYMPIADMWEIHRNFGKAGLRLIAERAVGQPANVVDEEYWEIVIKGPDHE